ncbi:zinc finger MYND domain-containing protein 12 isoform X1 [Phascolarctos cinereus]|uniref:Zinc finger MYND domain-containing protein 12 isoform X1 n=1 Tax=Phascolarctos cinereus TaxID=38626 RepID=A0A6P5K1V4_PHACI|nr:zinc finger MYND domain-containing protein 12 isoform X1 [Phascolarctos cinereus]
MNEIYPLAVPKGRKLKCEVCEAPAERVCGACTVTYYCGVAHQRADWASIHEKICQLLIPLRTTLPFYNSEEERKHGREQLLQRQKHLIELCYKVAQKYLFEGKHEESVPAALHSLRFRINVYGLNSVQLVPAYLLLSEASIGLGHIVQAEEYLSQAQWTVLKSTDCNNEIHSLLHRNLGLLYTAKENYEDARYHLANDIYFASCVYGSEDVRTSGAYFLMANVFFHQKKMDVADSMYTKVTDIWHTFLDQHIQNQLCARKKPADILAKELENDTGLGTTATAIKDPEKKVYATKVLGTIQWLNIRNRYDFISGSDIKEPTLPFALLLGPKDNGIFPSDLQQKPAICHHLPNMNPRKQKQFTSCQPSWKSENTQQKKSQKSLLKS